MKRLFITIAQLGLAILYSHAAPEPVSWTGDVLPDYPTNWTSTTNAFIGNTSTGSLTIYTGGTVDFALGYIGSEINSTGTVTVTGTDAVWTSPTNLFVGHEGDGTLVVANGGAVSNLWGFLGTTNESSGTAIVTGTNSVWANAATLRVGLEGDGTLTVTNGGAISSLDGTIGGHHSGTGTVTVTGTDSVWDNSHSFWVGYHGNGTLTIADGGKVTNQSGYIGDMSDGTGVVIVTGTHSVWSNSGNLTVGYYGDGTLSIADGGTVDSTAGYIGLTNGSIGSVTVNGTNSVWTNTSSLTVGHSGDGTLTIEDGGTVSSLSARIGATSNAMGTVTVIGANSIWSNAGDLTVGDYGDGALTVASEGQVNVRGNLSVNSSSSITLASGGRLQVGGDATLASGSLLEFMLADEEEPGLLTVDGTLANEGATLKVSSMDTLVNYAEYELIRAGTVSNSFATVDTNDVLSIYAISLASTETNITATVLGVKAQDNSAPAIAKASTVSANMTMNHISKYAGMARSTFRSRSSSGGTPAGAAGPNADQTSGEWVGYLRQFNDLGGQDSDGSLDGYDWQTSGYLIGLEKRVTPQLLIGLGAGQSWTDLDGLNGSGGGASDMAMATLYAN